jgi:hypothetical protein
MLESEDYAMHACTSAADVAFDLIAISFKGSSTLGHQSGHLKNGSASAASYQIRALGRRL